MRMPNPAVLGVSLALAALSLVGAAPVPRQSPELTIFDPAGKHIALSSFKGKVVAVEFLLTNCPHCWRLAQTLAKLQKELGPRGFQPLAVAFDKNIDGKMVTDFVGRSRIAFPVDYTTADRVDAYLGRHDKERFQVPQIVIIDRAGTVLAQSRPTGEKNLESEAYLRSLIGGLLKEDAPPPSKQPGLAPSSAATAPASS